ncbi:hypothetical protein RHS01_03830 [Rhizoctonia solani]|uniref:Uncharacterized protein n=1 Tax=Rhizoctonia solani TaxID=456999 RepID=A0A8H7IDX8_9AGAM|nr:hypothetical protein RHS01_03830 [Rhizoctonia solani]
MAKHDTLSDADHTSVSTSDKGQPVVTYVRVGRGMIKVTKYEKEDKATRQAGLEPNEEGASSIHSFDSSQPHAARPPSVKSRASSGAGSKSSSMPAWVSKFKKSKKGKNSELEWSIEGPTSSSHEDDSSYVLAEQPRNMLAPPSQHPGMLTPPSSPIPSHPRPLRAAHSHNDLPTAQPNEMWASIAQLESELVARYGRGAVPQLEALRMRMQNPPSSSHYEAEGQPIYQQIEWEDTLYARDDPESSWETAARHAPSVARARTRTETLPGRTATTSSVPPVPPIPSHYARAFVDDLDVYPRNYPSPVQPAVSSRPTENPEDGDSDDAAAYLQALGLEPPTPKGNKPKMRTKAQNSYDDTQIRHPEPARSTTLPTYPPKNLPRGRPDAGPINSHLDILEQYTTGRYNLPVQIMPPCGVLIQMTFSHLNHLQQDRNHPDEISRHAHHHPVHSHHMPLRTHQLRSRGHHPYPVPAIPMSLTVPSAHALRSAGSNGSANSSQLALPLVRVRITCPPQPSFAAATWAQMVTYCARNAGVSIARRGGGGALRVSVEERMAELTTPGGGRGVGDEEVGFGLGYYVSVEMTLEGDIDYQDNEGSVPVASLSIPLPTTLGELAIVFRERRTFEWL